MLHDADMLLTYAARPQNALLDSSAVSEKSRKGEGRRRREKERGEGEA